MRDLDFAEQRTWLDLSTRVPGAESCQIVSSGDGPHLVATVDECGNREFIYTSSDFGSTLTAHSTSLPQGFWIDMTMSKDGSHVYVVPGYAQESIWASSDYGVTWHAVQTLGLEYRRIASSADGQRLLAYQSSGLVSSSEAVQS